MNQLYEKITHGDRRTIVKKYSKGRELHFKESTIILKTDVAVKVLQEYDATSRLWMDITYDLATMVEIPDGEAYKANRPPPTHIPSGCDHVAAMTTDGPCPVCFPEARVRRPWWRFW